MTQQLRTKIKRPSAIVSLMAVIVLAGAEPAWAVPVTVNGTFTSFRSWLLDPATAQAGVMNGTTLSSSGVVVGNELPNGNGRNYFQSNTVNFTTPTTVVNFYQDTALGQTRFNELEWTPNTYNYPDVCDNCAFDFTPFLLGVLRFTNGAWFPRAEIGIRLTTVSSSGDHNGHVYEGTIHLLSTSTLCFLSPNPTLNQANAEADYLYVATNSISNDAIAAPDLTNSGRVYESNCQPPSNPGNVGTFGVIGHIGSLHVDYLTAMSEGGFTNDSVTDQLAPTAVPEPASLTLMGLGLLGLGVARRRRV